MTYFWSSWIIDFMAIFRCVAKLITHWSPADLTEMLEISKVILVTDCWGISFEIALRWLSLDLTGEETTSVQVMAWSFQVMKMIDFTGNARRIAKTLMAIDQLLIRAISLRSKCNVKMNGKEIIHNANDMLYFIQQCLKRISRLLTGYISVDACISHGISTSIFQIEWLDYVFRFLCCY